MASKKDTKSSSSKSQTNQAAKKAEKTASKDSKSKSKSSDSKSSSSSKSKSNGGKKQIKITTPKLLKFVGIVALIIITIILVDFVVQYINNDYSVAIVNGERLQRSEYEEELEDTYGAVIATQLINEAIIMQEAEKEGIEVDEEKIDEMIEKTIEELGGEEEYLAALESNGISEETFRHRLSLQYIAEKLLVEDPSDDDLKAFFEEYKDVYWTPETTYEDVEEEIKDIYVTQKFNEESAAWLAEISASADIQNNVTDEQSYGILVITRGFFSDLNNRLEE